MTNLAKLLVIQTPLSDGSFVYDIQWGNILLNAVTGKDAHELADKIADAVRAHANEHVQIHFIRNEKVA